MEQVRSHVELVNLFKLYLTFFISEVEDMDLDDIITASFESSVVFTFRKYCEAQERSDC